MNDETRGIAASGARLVSRRPHLARRAVHAAVGTVAAVLAGLAIGAVCAPLPSAAGQTASASASASANGNANAVAPERPLAAGLDARTENGATAALPLTDETLAVTIHDGHATAVYDHVFQNETGSRLEGNYHLLVGDGATATGFAYWNGEEKIVGEIFERDAARGVYEAMTGLHRDPGLLEQAGEGAFSFRVFPIAAGERKHVQVSTSRWVPRRDGVIEYRARLSRADAKVAIVVDDARGISSLESTSHDLAIEKTSATSWKATAVRPKGTGDEVVLRYQVAAPPLSLAASVHHDDGEPAFFTATIAAPRTPAANARPGTDVTLVLDRSGSMSGDSIESARAAAKAIVERLDARDRVNVIVFDDKVDVLFSEPEKLTDGVRRQVDRFIDDIQVRGGTDIAAALSRALASQKKDAQPDVVLFLTDGQSDGPAAVKVAAADTSDTRVFTVGIGLGVDKALLTRLASIKHGRFTFVPDPRAVKEEFPKVLSQLEEPALTDVTLRAEGDPSVKIERMYPATIGDLFPGDELRVFGRATGQGAGTGATKLVLEGKEHGVPRRFETAIDTSSAQARPWVARGWARARIDDLLEQTREKGESEELKNEAIELGLAFEIVTPYTSFLAIPESEMTAAAKAATTSMRDKRKAILAANKDAAALSRLNMPPGDPILKVSAPRDAKRVTAMFPFGVSQDLAWDEFSESWMTRFLVPKDVADGAYEIPVVIVLADGKVTATTVSYTIDSSAPAVNVDARVVDGGVELRVTTDEPALEVRAIGIGVGGSAVVLGAGDGGRDATTFFGRVALPPGKHRVRVVVADRARNEAEKTVDVEVPR